MAHFDYEAYDKLFPREEVVEKEPESAVENFNDNTDNADSSDVVDNDNDVTEGDD